ncbi:MAG: hypothetical protein KIT22_00770 [Verrucomicrobiae bacterium]|nr:hypothetical protein [Verrucomicrobiae bacterium]
MAAVEERISRLEDAVARFVEQSSAVFAAAASIHEDVAEIRASNVRTDQALLRLRQESEERWKKSDERWKKFEVQAEKDRQQAEKDRQQAEKERKDFNKRMAEISDRVGRFVEDMVHPNAERIAGKLFGADPVITLSIRVKRKHPADASRMIELDLLVAGESHLLVGEAKSSPTVEKANAFLEKVREVPDYFPEYAGHTVLPLLASISFDPSLVAYLSRRRIYALGFGDETMELLNEGAMDG